MLKIAVQMDPIAGISIKTDTTFALSFEAQNRGYQLFYYTPDQLCAQAGRVTAYAQELHLRQEQGRHYSLGTPQWLDLAEVDVVLLRQDPPFNMDYITTTYLLEQISKKTLIVNDPHWVRNSPEKIFVTEFSQFMVPTLITQNSEAVLRFREEVGDLVIKPLYGNGGEAVVALKKEDNNLPALLEMYKRLYGCAFVAQAYIKEAPLGDKRVIFVDGKKVGAINRVPGKQDIRGNLHIGGRAEATQLTPKEEEICQAIGKKLYERNLFFVGIDLLGGYLTEINVTSPAGVQEVLALSGIDIAKIFWQKIEEKLISRGNF